MLSLHLGAKEQRKELRARSSPALTPPAAPGAALLDGTGAQARALGFWASVSVKVNIKRVLIPILGPASLRATVNNFAIKARGRWTTATTGNCWQEEGQANKAGGLQHGVLREHQRHWGHGSTCVLLLISPAGTALSPPFGYPEGDLIPWRRAAAVTYRHEPSQHTRGTISTPGPLTFSSSASLAPAEQALNHLGLPKLIINSHILKKKTFKLWLPPLVLTATAWPCFASAYMSLFQHFPPQLLLPSSHLVFHSVPFSLSFVFLNILNIIFLPSVTLCLPSSKLLPSLTASNFTWLGGKKESNKFTVTNSLALRESRATLLPCPVAYTLPAGCHIHSLQIWNHRPNVKAGRVKEINF